MYCGVVEPAIIPCSTMLKVSSIVATTPGAAKWSTAMEVSDIESGYLIILQNITSLLVSCGATEGEGESILSSEIGSPCILHRLPVYMKGRARKPFAT